LYVLLSGEAGFNTDWKNASRKPVGLAPDPELNREAIIQVYAARSFSWRGAFSVHTWIAAKPENADKYKRYEVIGWLLYREKSAVSIENKYAADAKWFGAKPYLIKEIRGELAKQIIKKLPDAVKSYPYPNNYHAWPGPNSNTFIAHIARQLPELRLKMPSNAVGKDFITGWPITTTPSGTGYMVSLFGIFAILWGKEEGFEINILGLNIGIDTFGMAIKLPGIGRVGKPIQP